MKHPYNEAEYKQWLSSLDKEALILECLKLKNEVEDLFKKLDEAKAENAELDKTVDALVKEYSKLSRRLEELEAELVKKNALIRHLSEQCVLKNGRIFGKSSEKEKFDKTKPAEEEAGTKPAEEEAGSEPAEEEAGSEPVEDGDEEEVVAEEDGGSLRGFMKVTLPNGEVVYVSKKPRRAAKTTAPAPAAGNGGDAAPKDKGASKRRGGNYHGRKIDLSKLPQVDVYHLDAEEADRIYGKGNWHLVGFNTSQKLERFPSFFYTLNDKYPIFAYGEDRTMYAEPSANPLLPRSFLGVGLATHIIYEKFCKSVPFYRLEKQFAGEGVPVPRNDMAIWANHLGDLVYPVYEYELHYLLENFHYIHIDESRWKVILDGRKAGSWSWIWGLRSGSLQEGAPVIVYIYEPTRSAQVVVDLLKKWTGTVNSDDYVAYTTLRRESDGRIVIALCWMHVRRKYYDALKIVRAEVKDESVVKKTVEYKCVEMISDIYSAYEPLKKLSVEEREEACDKVVRPLVESFFKFNALIVNRIALIESGTDFEKLGIKPDVIEFDGESWTLGVAPYSETLRKAVNYTFDNMKGLSLFLDDGNIPIDNGPIERGFKGVAVDRKNSLFSCSVHGGVDYGVWKTVLGTASLNGLAEYAYINYLLTEMPKHSTYEEVEEEVLDEDGNPAGKKEKKFKWVFHDPEFLPDAVPWAKKAVEFCAAFWNKLGTWIGGMSQPDPRVAMKEERRKEREAKKKEREEAKRKEREAKMAGENAG